jgi:hypothetical protein
MNTGMGDVAAAQAVARMWQLCLQVQPSLANTGAGWTAGALERVRAAVRPQECADYLAGVLTAHIGGWSAVHLPQLLLFSVPGVARQSLLEERHWHIRSLDFHRARC